MVRLTQKKVEIIIRRKKKGLSSSFIAEKLEITKRRVNQIWETYQEKGSFELKKTGKLPVRILSEHEKKLILELREHQACGARIIAEVLRRKRKIKIANDLVHEFLLEQGMATPNLHKQQRRKAWIRYERKHSLPQDTWIGILQNGVKTRK